MIRVNKSKVQVSINGFLLNIVFVMTPITNTLFATICNMRFFVIQSYLYLEDLSSLSCDLDGKRPLLRQQAASLIPA